MAKYVSRPFDGAEPIELGENSAGEVLSRQAAESGNDQTVRLTPIQAEDLANGCIPCAQICRDIYGGVANAGG